MNPRASAPRIRSGLRGSIHSPSSSTVWCSVAGSASSGMMSLKTIPGSGKSGTSRILASRLTRPRAVAGRARRAAVRAPGPPRPGVGAPGARLRGGPGCASAAPALLARASGRCGLLPDDPERQELVPLQAQDRLQALDVVLAEEPVTALGATWRKQSLVLEVADLRDRDVRELGLQAPADGADREQPPPFLPFCLRRCGHFSRKVSLYLPIWSSSPFSSWPASMRLRFRKVPLRLPWSSM